MKRTRLRAGRIPRLIRRTIFFLFLSSFLYVLLLKWFFPPVTITQLGSLMRGEGLHREYISWELMAPSVKRAVIASEDQLFLRHHGFDWNAIRKSLSSNTRNHRRARGAAASTISQQTAKNVLLWQGSGWDRYLRKLPEAYFTLLLELIWGKRRILEVYLNVAEMGKGIYGIEAAAQAYYHKPASRLSQKEAAMIIAALPNPVRFTVVPPSSRVLARSPVILQQMRLMEGEAALEKLLAQ